MEVGDLIRWQWYSSGTGSAFEPWDYTQYRGIIIGERMEGLVRVLTVVDKLGAVEVRADEAEVINAGR